MSGLCIEWLLGGRAGGRAMYVSQTNQIEASMNNQSNCRLQQLVWMCWYLLTSAKHAPSRWRRNQCHFALFHAGLWLRELKLWSNIFFLRKGVLEYGFVLECEQKSLKPAKTLPWGGTIQRCLRFGEVALLTVRITDKSLVSPPTHRVVPRCFTLDYDQGNWNYDPTFFFEKRCFRIWIRIYTVEIRTEITETSENVTLRWK
jgi:hypothetical protein